MLDAAPPPRPTPVARLEHIGGVDMKRDDFGVDIM
jgi:hypothetical protein